MQAYLDKQALAKNIGQCTRTVDAWVKIGKLPQPKPCGLWKWEEVERALGGNVYFIECGDFIKIGFTDFLELRIKSIRGAIPFETNFLGAIGGTRRTEEYLHERFANLRHKGEWFRKEKSLVNYINAALAGRHE